MGQLEELAMSLIHKERETLPRAYYFPELATVALNEDASIQKMRTSDVSASW